jgi:hypothetical protein
LYFSLHLTGQTSWKLFVIKVYSRLYFQDWPIHSRSLGSL